MPVNKNQAACRRAGTLTTKRLRYLCPTHLRTLFKSKALLLLEIV